MYHLDPITDADRHYSERDREERALAAARKSLRDEMLSALKGDFSKHVYCPGSLVNRTRPAIDVAFDNASEAEHAAILSVLRAGAAGNDVQLLCSALISMLADTHAKTYCDAALISMLEAA